jgi:hypothetical protein
VAAVGKVVDFTKAKTRLMRQRCGCKSCREALAAEAPPGDGDGYTVVQDQGWSSFEEMLEACYDDIKNKKVVPPEGMAIIVYNEQFTTVYRRKLEYEEIKTILEDYLADPTPFQFDPDVPPDAA